jgi:hypothetical protein
MKSSFIFAILYVFLFTPFQAFSEETDTREKRDWGVNNVGPGSACLNEVAKASTACDFAKNDKLNSSAGMAQMAVLKISEMLSDKAKQANLNGQCDGVSQAASSVSLALGAFTSYCSVQFLQCQSACDRSAKEMAEITAMGTTYVLPAEFSGIEISSRSELVGEAKAECEKLKLNIAAAKNQFSKYVDLQNSMATCKNMTANSLEAKCKANPNDAMCSLLANNGDPNDCNSVAGKSNQVCICQANPNLPSCGGSQFAAGGAGKSNYNDGADGVDPGLGNFGGDGLGGGSYGDNIPPGSFSPTGGSGPSRAGQGGGGGGHGGGGGGGNPKTAGKGGAPAGSGLNTKILSGFASATGAAGGYRPSGGGYDSPSTSGGVGAPSNAAVDLKKFLPGGQMDPARGIAGISGPDGITIAFY